MKNLAGTILASCVLAVAGWMWTASAGDDPLAADRVTKVTQTEERDANGSLTRVEVVRDSRIAVTERVVENMVPNAAGQLYVNGRTTTTSRTDGSTTTVVEQILPGRTDLVVVSVTTDVKDANGGSETVVETRNEQGQMVTTKRIVVERVDGSLVTTTHMPDSIGRLFVSSRVVRQP